MSLAAFQRPKPSFLAEFDAFAANVEDRRRFLLTFKDGAHLVGVPTIQPVQDPTDPEARFHVTTAIASYAIPFRLLAYAQQLVESGLRASDGQEPVPEPCTGPARRTKHEKFAILDSPRQLADDLQDCNGVFGVAVLYADIDHFKALNTTHTERVIDRTVLPEFQRTIAAAMERHGYAYAEGGDEVVLVLPNTSISLGAAFAEELRRKIEAHRFIVDEGSASITLSIGLASSTSELSQLADWANKAKQEAKRLGRNRTVTTSDGVTFREVPTEAAELTRTPE